MTQRFTQSAPKPPAPVAQQAPARQQPAQRVDAPKQPARQPELKLDPADRMTVSRTEEEMLDIPAFLRRQAN